MKTSTLAFSLISALSPVSGLTAQQGFDARLGSVMEVALSGKPVALTLTLDVKEKCSVPATLLSGLALATTVNGKAGPKLTERVAGKVTLAAGTRIERRLSVDISEVVTKLDKSNVTRISFEWIGLEGVSTVVDIAPDLKDVDVDDLDLSRTKVLLVTSHGDMLVKFHPDKAPKTVQNFVKLAKDGFYDGTQFHRVLRGFMIQGGCPNTKKGQTGRPGTGGPGYSIKAEFNATRHVKGVLSMARSGDPDSAGSQFFVVHAQAPHLDGQYTAFGELVTGEDTLDKIANVPVGGPQRSTPEDPVHLKAAVVQPVFKKK